MSFGNRLKQLRLSKSLTQQQLADILKLSKANISKYESNSVEPNIETLKLLSSMFNVSIDYLLGQTEKPLNIISKKSQTQTLDIKKGHLLKNYEKLNDDGKNKLLDYSEDLIASNKYNNDLILSTVAARSKDNSEPIKQEYMKDLSKIPPDDTDL